MGMWKRCSQCGGKIQIIPMIRIKESEPEKEAWACRACKTLEVHPVVPTEKDIEKREKAQAVREAMTTAIIFSKDAGIEYLYLITGSDSFSKVLRKSYLAKRVPGETLMIDLKEN